MLEELRMVDVDVFVKVDPGEGRTATGLGAALCQQGEPVDK